MDDLEVRVIFEKYPETFEKAVNALLQCGGWRVVQTEMSVTDHHYFAMLVRSDK